MFLPCFFDNPYKSLLVGGVMLSVLFSGAVDHEFDRAKDYKIDIIASHAMHTVLRSKRNYWLTRIKITTGATCLHSIL